MRGDTAGEIIRPGGVEVVRALLSETLLLPVYKDVCADVHAHFELLVQPTLSAHSRQRCVSVLNFERGLHCRQRCTSVLKSCPCRVCLVRFALRA